MENKIGECETGGGDSQKPVCGTDERQIQIALGPLDSTDIGQARAWRNDYRIWQWCRQNDFISDQDQVNWFQRQNADPSIKMYKISLSGADSIKMVGVCGLTSIDLTNRRAEFSLYIGPKYWGNGFGTKALGLLLDHAFTNLGLNMVWGEVFDDNPAMKIFLKLGFEFEGTRRNFYFRDGKFIDAHLISIGFEEWKILRKSVF